MSTIMLIVIIFFIILIAGVFYCEYDNPKFLWAFSVIWALAFMMMVLVFTGMKPSVTTPETEVEPNVYFVYAEKAAEKDGVVTFATVNLKDNQFYTWTSEYGTKYSDVPYILTMDSKGTATLEDDEILVVWANNN
jgi:hypothetical protein